MPAAYTLDELFGPADKEMSLPFRTEKKPVVEETKEEEEPPCPLQVEHVIGYSAQPSSFLSIPGKRDGYAKSMGSVVVVGDLNDPEQVLLRCDTKVGAMAVSDDGRLCAAGGVVWDLATRQGLKLRGVDKVTSLDFSPGSQFVATGDDDGAVYLWDAETGERIYGRRLARSVAFVVWVCAFDDEEHRRKSYRLAMGARGAADVDHCTMSFEVPRQSWGLEIGLVTMPSGLKRDFRCAKADGDFLYCGTSEGELVVTRLSVPDPARGGGVFRVAAPVCSGGLLALAVDGSIYAAGGDGFVRVMRGRDASWACHAKVRVDEAPVVSLSLAKDTRELLVGTASGKTFRALLDDITKVQHLSAAHVVATTGLAFATRPDVCATCACDGELKIWDLNDYTELASTRRAMDSSARLGNVVPPQKRTARAATYGDGATCLTWVQTTSVIAGFGDGHLRCFAASDGAWRWTIPDAHRASITAVACAVNANLAYLVSAAADGSVRVWNLSTKQLTMQFAEQTKPIVGVFIDLDNPKLFHTASRDAAVVTFDVSTERRKVAHLCRGTNVAGFAQRRDAERELITADTNGLARFWDCDILDGPVMTAPISTGGPRSKVTALAVSPAGSHLAVAASDGVSVFRFERDSVDTPPSFVAQASSAHVHALAWTPDQAKLLSVADDACICASLILLCHAPSQVSGTFSVPWTTSRAHRERNSSNGRLIIFRCCLKGKKSRGGEAMRRVKYRRGVETAKGTRKNHSS